MSNLAKLFDTNQTGWKYRFSQLVLIFILIVVARFGWMLALGRTLYFGDNYSLLVPGKLFTAQWLSQGIVPFWNPYVFSGLNWIGDISQSVFYLSTLLFMWLAPSTALNLTVIFHLGVALAGMYLFTSVWTGHHSASLIGATLWALSTQVTGSINNLATIQSIVWVPFLMWAAILIGKKVWAGPVFAVLVFIQIAAGYPLHVFFGVGLAVVLSLYRSWGQVTWFEWVKNWVLVGLVSAGLSAFYWLPFIEVASGSTRMLQSNAQATQGSLNPAMLLKPLLPYIFDKPTAGMKWGPAWSGHPNAMFYLTWLGTGVVGVGFFSLIQRLKTTPKAKLWTEPLFRDRAFFSLIVLVSLVFAMGSYVPGFELLQQVLPIFRIARYPSMVIMITNLILALWVAVELPRLRLSFTAIRKLIVVAVVIMGVSLVAWLIIRTNFELIWTSFDSLVKGRLSSSVFHTLDRDRVIAEVVTTNLIGVAGLAAVSVWALSKKWWNVLVLLVVVDLLYSTQGVLFFVPASVYPNHDQVIAQQRTQQAPFSQLIGSESRALMRNTNQPYTSFDSYWEAMVVRAPFSDSFVDRYELITGQHAIRLRDGATPDWNMVYRVPTLQGYSTLLPQDYAALWEESELSSININSLDHISILNPLLRDWAVKYYVVDTWFEVDEEFQLFPIVAQDKTWTVYELPALSRFRYRDDQPINLTSLEETPNQIQFEFENIPSQSHLKIADRYDSNWRAWINNQPVTIENYQGMRQLPIVAGMNQVKLEYYPRLLYIGLAVSLLSAGVLGAGCWRLIKRQA